MSQPEQARRIESALGARALAQEQLVSKLRDKVLEQSPTPVELRRMAAELPLVGALQRILAARGESVVLSHRYQHANSAAGFFTNDNQLLLTPVGFRVRQNLSGRSAEEPADSIPFSQFNAPAHPSVGNVKNCPATLKDLISTLEAAAARLCRT